LRQSPPDTLPYTLFSVLDIIDTVAYQRISKHLFGKFESTEMDARVRRKTGERVPADGENVAGATSAATPAARRRANRNNRVEKVLDAAADLFGSKGYRETTVRDISQAVDMLPGSLYYHFPSKHDLLLATYEEGVRRLIDRVSAAVADTDMPAWARLENALAAHLETILDHTGYARVMIRVLPEQVPEKSEELTVLRNRYEKLLASVLDDVPVAADVSRKMLRLLLLGAANWSQVWYREDGDSPRDLAKHFVRLVQGSARPDGV